MIDYVWLALIVLIGLVAVALVSALAIVLFIRIRARDSFGIDVALLVRVYLYVGVIVGMLVLTQGLSHLLNSGMAAAWGKDFSYRPVYVFLEEDNEPFIPHPLEEQDWMDLTEEERDQLGRIRAEREIRRLEVEEKRRRVGLNQAADEGLIEGVSFTVIGALIVGAHLAGRGLLRSQTASATQLRRAYLIVATVTFGALTVASLPQALFESLRFWLIDPVDGFGRDYQPGEKLALSIVALPIWLAYLWATIQSVRDAPKGQPQG